MLLYFKPGACSLSARIVLNELNLPFEAVQVDTDIGRTANGSDYLAINPKGYVPALEVSPGLVLTESPAILQYLADQVPEAALAPDAGTLEHVRLQEWLNYTSSELHKAFAPWFSGRALEGNDKARAEANLARRIDHVEHALSDGRAYILGQNFTVADSYLFVVLNWANFINLDLGRWPQAAAFAARIAARPAVREAIVAEGLTMDEAA